MAKTKLTQYISKYRELRLINKASYSKEVEGKVIVVQGSSIQFHDGVYSTSDENEIKFLDNHPNCGGVFIKVKKNVVKEQADMDETLEEREAKVKAKEEELVKKEMKLRGQEKEGQEEGSKPSTKGIRGTKDTKKTEKETKKPKF